jgi:hypothetical protein
MAPLRLSPRDIENVCLSRKTGSFPTLTAAEKIAETML